jgi:RNA polymerase sigma factor (sigma-70 family)
MRRAVRGEQDAVRQLIDDLQPRVGKLATHYAARTGENRDDLLQEAWIGLLEALSNLDQGIGQSDCYLLRHARWRLLDAVKRWRRRRLMVVEDALLHAQPSSEPYNAMESSAFLDEFVRELTPTQQAVVDRLLRGLTWRETGDEMGCTSANVAYHVRQIQRSYDRWNETPADELRR